MESLTTSTCIQTVARLRSISAAAEELGISQPALSARVKKLENQLGAQVFDRSRTPLEITDAGHAYLETQEAIQALNRKLAKRIDDLKGLGTGSLVIGGASLFNSTLLPKAVASFLAEHPAVDIRIVTDTVPNLMEGALAGSIDLFVTPIASDNMGLAFEPLLEERIFLSIAADSPTARKLPPMGTEGFAAIDATMFGQLQDETFIVHDKRLQLGRKLEQLFKRYGFVPQRTVAVDQTSTGLALSQAGVGVAFVTESALASVADAARPALYLADEDICTRKLFIARRKGAPVSRAEAEFTQHLERVATEA